MSGGKKSWPFGLLAAVGSLGLALPTMAGDVLGLWTFDQASGAAEIADGTAFPNQVEDGTLSLKAKVQRWPGLKEDSPVFVNDGPAA